MTTAVEIANLALSFIGTRSTIASLTELSEEARTIALHYDFARRDILRAAYWNFARAQASLALLKDGTQPGTPIPPQPWVYEYALPVDSIMPRSILPQVEISPPTAGVGVGAPYYLSPPVRFLVSGDTDADGNQITVILTNQPQAQLIYTRDVVNENLFDPQFTVTFAHLLASRSAMALTGDKEIVKNEFAIANSMSLQAQARNGNEGLTVIDSVPDWMRVRGYNTDWAYPWGGYFYYAPQNITQIA